MPNEPIIQRQPAVQVNPFARQGAEHVSAGTVAIESERAIAEAQGKLVIAKRFPRQQAVAYANIIDACRRSLLAEEACYSFPRGGEVVAGPTIRLAEMLAANWGNVDYGIRELSRKDGVSEMEAYCWDLETNTMSSQKFTVRHIRDTKRGQVTLTDERDIYELTANLGARRLRARILAILPADLVQAAVDQCKKTIASGGDVPIADRIRSMVLAFKTLGVPAALIEKRLGHSLESINGDELADLRQIHNSLRDGMSALTDWFGDKPAENAAPGDDVPMDDKPKDRPTPPPREKRSRQAAPTQSDSQTAAPKADAAPATEPASPPTPQPEKAPDPKPEPAPEPKAEPTPEAPKARTTLNPEETATFICTVKTCSGIIINDAGKPQPTVSAQLTGEYEGTVYHIGGGEQKSPDKVTPNAPWADGALVKITLYGRVNKLTKKTLVVVKDIASAEASGTMEVA